MFIRLFLARPTLHRPLRRLSALSVRTLMTSSTTTPANPATLFKSPVRAIWNVQGENVPTLWWPAKGQLTTKSPKGTEQPVHTVLFMIPGTLTYTHTAHLRFSSIDLFTVASADLSHSLVSLFLLTNVVKMPCYLLN
jgi:hypothetical protein